MKNLIKLFGLFFLFNLSNIIASEAGDSGDSKAAAERQQLKTITIVNHEVPELKVEVNYKGQRHYNPFRHEFFLKKHYCFNLISQSSHLNGQLFENLMIKYSDFQGNTFEVVWLKDDFNVYETNSNNLVLYAVLLIGGDKTKLGLLTESDYLKYLNEQLNNILSQNPELLIKIRDINMKGVRSQKLGKETLPEVEFDFYSYIIQKWDKDLCTIEEFRAYIQREIKKEMDKQIASQNDFSLTSSGCIVQ